MIVGQSVVCIDDTFHPEIAKLFVALPRKNQVYVIREITLGINALTLEEGEVTVPFVGLHNPRSNVPPYPERGFRHQDRFRELEDITDQFVKKEEFAEIL